MQVGQRPKSSKFECGNREWLLIGGIALISGISGFVGSQFSSVAWEGVTFIAGN
jgi:APA family basic amino acid/polyamine antiporter